ncbi:MAG: gamma-glutamyl-gamma-aminobutyrate hydrolase family protein, partial [Gemmatimonadales bacterium]|nr:gamma-glutamyl-gamma-aminobutyrate hydrolase family protein [Gemmatimonadales bacterium]
MTPPRIAISGRVTNDGGKHHTGVQVDYVHSVAEAGGLPLLLSPLMDLGHAIHALEGSDGLLLSGGEDVDPSHYGADPSQHLKEIDPRRDAFELALFTAAKERGLPILAICRGLQLVNVALGGTLWQDLPSEVESELNHDVGDRWDIRSHSIALRRDTELHDTLECKALLVNSFHHQAIRDLAPGLTVTAEAEDGIIEAVEHHDNGWLLG